MKKFSSIAVLVILTLVLAACGEENQKTASVKPPKPKATATATADTSADTDGDGLMDDYDPDPYAAEEDDSAPTDDEGYYEDEEVEPETDQTVRSVGEWGKDEGVKFKVTSMEEVDSIAPAPPAWLHDGITDKPGSKLVEVRIDIKNDGNTEIDPLCGMVENFVLLDQNDRNFQPLDDPMLDINNNICDEGISPGFKSSYKLAYRIPNKSDISGLVAWNGESDDDYDGSLTQVLFLP